LLYYLTIN